jgi:hypothetical protein
VNYRQAVEAIAKQQRFACLRHRPAGHKEISTLCMSLNTRTRHDIITGIRREGKENHG